MTLPLTPHAATLAVLWGGLAIGLAFGALAQASAFCTMGAIADWFAYRGTARLAMWALAVAVAACGAQALVAAGWLDANRALPWSPDFTGLSYVVGGAVFGFGMVLASGCPQRNLVRAGSGNLKSLVVLVVAGLAAQMCLRGLFASWRVKGLDSSVVHLAKPQDLGSLLAPLAGISPAAVRALGLLLVLGVAARALWSARAGLDRWQWAGGVGVGLLVALAWVLTGHLGYLPENPDTLEAAWMGTASHRPEGLSFIAPLGQTLDLLTLWTDASSAPSFGVAVACGVLLGATASALARREFRLEGFRDAGDLANHLVGAVMMGFGGVTAAGCTIGQGISGLSLLSAGSATATAAIVAGAWAGLRWQSRRLDS